MKANWNFQRGRGGGFKLKKKHPWGRHGYFLEPHKLCTKIVLQNCIPSCIVQDGIIYLTAISVFRNLASTIAKDCKEF